MSEVIERLRNVGCWTRSTQIPELVNRHASWVLTQHDCVQPPVVTEGENTLLVFCADCGGTR
jgi:hypothetical protein